MKLRSFLVLLASIGLTHSISFAQRAENQNPYAIFGSKPFVAGAEQDREAVKVFVIENMTEGSHVARLEHNTETGIVTYFDIAGEILGHKQMKQGERAWPSVDPKAESYYSVSPYAYVANNPVKYVDPDGTTIRMSDFVNNQKIDYEWRDYQGTWGFYDSNNALYAGSNQFIGQVSGALNDLMNGGQAGFDLVSGLANHSNVLTMWQRNSSGAVGNDVGWNPTGVRSDGSLEAVPTTAGMSNDPTMTLGHELGHIEYNWSGQQSSTWFSVPTATGNRNISTSEIHTTHRENQLRSENGLPLRTHYGVDQYGAGMGPRIIVPSTGASRYYNSQGVTNYNPLKRRVTPYTY